jgi:hypothetical protein
MRSGRSELFDKRTDPIFDPLGAAEIAADLAIIGLLEPSRAARLITFNARDKNNPHFREVVDSLIGSIWKAPISGNRNLAEIQRTVQIVLVNELMKLASREDAQIQVRGIATEGLHAIVAVLKSRISSGQGNEFNRPMLEDIEKFLARPDSPRTKSLPLPEPPSDPIG